MAARSNLADKELEREDGWSDCTSDDWCLASENSELKQDYELEKSVAELEEGFNECLQLVHPVSGTYKLKIKGWSMINLASICSNYFTVGDQSWYLEIYPKGYRKSDKVLSMVIHVKKDTLPTDKSVFAELEITLRDQLHGHDNCITSEHSFDSDYPIFRSGVPLDELNDPSSGFIVNDTCIFEAKVTVHGYRTSYDVKY